MCLIPKWRHTVRGSCGKKHVIALAAHSSGEEQDFHASRRQSVNVADDLLVGNEGCLTGATESDLSIKCVVPDLFGPGPPGSQAPTISITNFLPSIVRPRRCGRFAPTGGERDSQGAPHPDGRTRRLGPPDRHCFHGGSCRSGAGPRRVGVIQQADGERARLGGVWRGQQRRPLGVHGAIRSSAGQTAEDFTEAHRVDLDRRAVESLILQARSATCCRG